MASATTSAVAMLSWPPCSSTSMTSKKASAGSHCFMTVSLKTFSPKISAMFMLQTSFPERRALP